MKNDKKYLNATAKIHKFARVYTLWVVGGNHHWEAYIALASEKVPDPKGHHPHTLATVYWWPDYSMQTVQEVMLLAAWQNADSSLRSAMSFHNKVLY